MLWITSILQRMGKNLILSNQIIPPMSLLTGIVLIFVGGWLKRNKKSKKGYRILFVAGGVFMILSAVLSVGGISSYIFPLQPIFVVVACVVLFIEAFLVWRLSTRGGRKAMV